MKRTAILAVDAERCRAEVGMGTHCRPFLWARACPRSMDAGTGSAVKRGQGRAYDPMRSDRSEPEGLFISIRVAALDYVPYGHGDDPQVEPQRLSADILAGQSQLVG